MIGSCQYIKFGSNYVVTHEGNSKGDYTGSNLNDCAALCNEETGCYSFTYCKDWFNNKKCHLKDRSLKGSEPYKHKSECTTYFHYCGKRWLQCSYLSRALKLSSYPYTCCHSNRFVFQVIILYKKRPPMSVNGEKRADAQTGKYIKLAIIKIIATH